jgi:hypothetical protein
MNALFRAHSKLKSTILAIQEAKHALSQNCANNGYRGGLGGGGSGAGARFGHIGSYRRRGVFFSGGGTFMPKQAHLSRAKDHFWVHWGKSTASCARRGRAQDNQGAQYHQITDYMEHSKFFLKH